MKVAPTLAFIARSLHPREWPKLLELISRVLVRLKRYQLADQLLSEALEAKHMNTRVRGWLLSRRGRIHEALGEMEDAYDFYANALGCVEAENDAESATLLKLSQAALCEKLGRDSETVEILVNLVGSLGTDRVDILCDAYQRLGYAYARLDRTGEAIRCYRRSLEYMESKEDSSDYCRTALNLAALLVHDGEYHEAERITKSVKQFAETKREKLWAAWADELSVDVLVGMGDLSNAEVLARKTIAVREAVGDWDGKEAYAYARLGLGVLPENRSI